MRPNRCGPAARLAVRPSSPPDKLRNIRDAAKTSSPTPSEISANTTPARRVVSAPNSMPKKRPAAAPASGTSGIGSPKPALIARMTWIAAKPPKPKYTAWPNESRPVCPRSRLYDSANTVAMAIWLKSERPKLLLKPGICGRTSNRPMAISHEPCSRNHALLTETSESEDGVASLALMFRACPSGPSGAGSTSAPAKGRE